MKFMIFLLGFVAGSTFVAAALLPPSEETPAIDAEFWPADHDTLPSGR